VELDAHVVQAVVVHRDVDQQRRQRLDLPGVGDAARGDGAEPPDVVVERFVGVTQADDIETALQQASA
jgi:hypothetical protein